MSEVIPFLFEKHQVRAVADDSGNPLLCAADVCAILGYANGRDAVSKHCRPDGVAKRDIIDRMGRTQSLTFISEGNLYRLISKSQKPEAERFESWVFDDVIPKIRKTGKYAVKRQARSAAPVHPIIQAARMIPTLVRSLKACGIDKNVAAVSANQIATQITGANLLQAAGHTYLDTPDQTQYFNASELLDGVSGMKINKMLAGAGMHERIGDNWVLTERGHQFGRVLDSGKRKGNGQMIQHTKWSRDVLQHISLSENSHE